MNNGHFIDDPLNVVNVKPDFSGLGMEPIHINNSNKMNREETRKRMGQRIADLRKDYQWKDEAGINRQGLTQTELAERCGIAQSNVARIEGGKYSPGLDLLETIAEAMGRHVDIV